MINANQKMKMTTIPMLMNCILIISQMGETTGGHALHASSYQIQHLWESEQQVIRHIQDVLLSMEDIKQVLNMYVSSWESIVEGQKDIAGIPDDPVATFALLRHVAEGWREVDSTLTKVKDMYKNIEYLASRPDSEALPNNDDVLQATEALVKLAHIYRFNATALERGLFIQEALNKDITDSLDTSTSSAAYPLSQNDLVSIGLTAVNKGYFNIGVEFLRAAKSMSSARNMSSIQKNKQFRSASHFSLERIESLLNTAIKVHNHVLNTQGPRSLTHTASVTPYGTSDNNRQLPLDDNQVIIGGEYLNLHDNKTWMLNQRALVEQQQVERLCRGDNLRPISVRSTLSCRNYNGRDPWLLLGPFRIEELSHDPHITVIYDVITPEESQSIISTARADLESPHNSYVNKSEDATLSRWSLKHVWLDNQSAHALQSLSRRLAHVTRVHVDDNTSEPFMVANYGIGGEYSAHRDTHGPYKSPPHLAIGERLTTLVTYLQAPLSGGRLVFPWAGLSVKPVEGAAVVWWNLLASHEHDFLTRHASCPILRGHKWIVTKWVGYNAQWNIQPCPLDPSRKITLG